MSRHLGRIALALAALGLLGGWSVLLAGGLDGGGWPPLLLQGASAGCSLASLAGGVLGVLALQRGCERVSAAFAVVLGAIFLLAWTGLLFVFVPRR